MQGGREVGDGWEVDGGAQGGEDRDEGCEEDDGAFLGSGEGGVRGGCWGDGDGVVVIFGKCRILVEGIVGH